MDQFQKACNLVSKLLAQHPRTVVEIRKKLEGKNFEEKVVSKTIKYFLNQGFLSDEKYIELWLENQLRYRPSSRAFCKKKLYEKGLNKNLIRKILDEKYSPDKEMEVAYQLALKKVGKLKERPQTNLVNTLGQFLDRKGFPENVIWSVLERLRLVK